MFQRKACIRACHVGTCRPGAFVKRSSQVSDNHMAGINFV